MYEYFMMQFDRCRLKVRMYTDERVRRFYLNAAQGFKEKAMRLTVENA